MLNLKDAQFQFGVKEGYAEKDIKFSQRRRSKFECR